ncbi:MAG: sulfotransferase [Gammaproteobacteria bacterium]|nr:sulfotransferase [Gammaproteobacteria bacterium]
MAIDEAAPDVKAYRHMVAGRFADALPFAREAVTGQPRCLPAHGMLATILARLGRAAEADAVVRAALELEEGSADAYDGLAHVSLLLGKHERSNELYKRVVTLAAGDARFWYNLAASERSFGRLGEAEAACDRAIALDAMHYPAYLLRSELRPQTQDANHVRELETLLAHSGVQERARVSLGYALAKELDDLGRYAEAFRWFSAAAQARRRLLSYDVAVDERKLQRIAAAYPLDALRRVSPRGDSARYAFIVGLPRSGTTLVEHILQGLPGIRSNGETDNFSQALLAAAPAGGSDVFARAAAADPVQVAANYAQLAGAGGPEIVLEKLPMNYLYLGAVHRALPEAKLILVSRDPLDSCFAMYRTLFAAAYPFTYDFEDLARYYAAYDRLMRHWRAGFGAQIHEVQYEELVADPAKVGAALANYCGLEWTPTALDVHRRGGVSLTASAAQIRRPIYGSSSGRWRHYRVHLAPLVAALRRQGLPVPAEAGG